MYLSVNLPELFLTDITNNTANPKPIPNLNPNPKPNPKSIHTPNRNSSPNSNPNPKVNADELTNKHPPANCQVYWFYIHRCYHLLLFFYPG